jgi:hypothetical protein
MKHPHATSEPSHIPVEVSQTLPKPINASQKAVLSSEQSLDCAYEAVGILNIAILNMFSTIFSVREIVKYMIIRISIHALEFRNHIDVSIIVHVQYSAEKRRSS